MVGSEKEEAAEDVSKVWQQGTEVGREHQGRKSQDQVYEVRR